MKRIVWGMLGLVALTSLTFNVVQARQGSKLPDSHVAQPRMAIINMAKVVRDYKHANERGAEIAEQRKEYVETLNKMRGRHAKLAAELAQSTDEGATKSLKLEQLKIQRQIEDLDRKAQEELSRQAQLCVAETYAEIQKAIKDIAEANDLQLVMSYVAASTPEEMRSPQYAQSQLQAPNLIPCYHKNLDITTQVLERLNAGKND